MSNQYARNSKSNYVKVKQQEYSISGNQAISDITITQVLWDVPPAGGELEPYLQYFIGTGNWETMKDGIYDIDYQIVWEALGVAKTGALRAFIVIDNSTQELACNSSQPVLNNFSTILSGSYRVKLKAGQFIGIKVFQTLSVIQSLNLLGSAGSPNRYCRVRITYSEGQ